MKRLTASLLLAACIAAAPASAPRTFALDDIPKIAAVSNVAISPDGKQIAFVLSRQNLKTDKNDATLERTQLPFKLAWAITVHKSQSLSLDKLIIGLGKREFSAASLTLPSRGRSVRGHRARRAGLSSASAQAWRGQQSPSEDTGCQEAGEVVCQVL